MAKPGEAERRSNKWSFSRSHNWLEEKDGILSGAIITSYGNVSSSGTSKEKQERADILRNGDYSQGPWNIAAGCRSLSLRVSTLETRTPTMHVC